MSTLHHRADRRHRHSQLTLFDWLAERELRTTDPVVRRLARQFGLTVAHARVVARLAGLGEQAR